MTPRRILLVGGVCVVATGLAFTAGVWGLLVVTLLCMGTVVMARTREERARAQRRQLSDALHDIDDPATRILARTALIDALTAPDASGRRASLAQAQAIIHTARASSARITDDAP